MQMILKGHAVREGRAPNGVYKQSPHTDRPIWASEQLHDQKVLPNWMNEL